MKIQRSEHLSVERLDCRMEARWNKGGGGRNQLRGEEMDWIRSQPAQQELPCSFTLIPQTFSSLLHTCQTSGLTHLRIYSSQTDRLSEEKWLKCHCGEVWRSKDSKKHLSSRECLKPERGEKKRGTVFVSNRDVFIHARSFKHLRGSAEPIVRLDLLRSTVSVISVYRTSGRTPYVQWMEQFSTGWRGGRS